MTKVSIVIPNFNGQELLQKNLPYIFAAKENKKNNIYEIIIVDDASSDNSISFLKESFSRKIKLFPQKENKGFAATVNYGVRRAKGDLICLINNDVVVAKDFLAKTIENFGDSQVFAVSLHEKGYGYAKGKFDKGFIVHEGKAETAGIHDTFWASGGSGIFRKRIWDELKGLDAKVLPFYFEDMDLCYRAQKRGFKVLWDSRGNVIHNHESTYKKLNVKYVQRMRERNYLLFNWKNITSKNLWSKHKKFLLKKLLRHPGYIRIFLMALSKWNIIKECRQIETRETTISDEAIFAKFN